MKHKNTGEIYNHWRNIQAGKIEMDDEDKAFIEAVKAALAAGLFYNRQVDVFCATILHPTEWECDPKSSGTEGGLFGHAIYHARAHIEFQNKLLARKSCASALAVGQLLKNVQVDSHKFSTMKLLEVNRETGWVTFTASKRGSSRTWNGSAPANALRLKEPLKTAKQTA